MWPTRSYVLGLVIYSTAVVGYSYGAVNNDADPYVIAMVNNASVGPDGPWWYISQSVDFPEQFVPMIPSISQSSLSVNDSACSSQESSCPLPLLDMWTLSKADGYKYENGTVMQSDPIYDAAKWDKDYATLLDMGGSGRRYNNRMTLHRNSDYADAAFLNHAMSISANYTVGYSANTYYTINAGFFSLDGVHETLAWDATNGTSVSGNGTLFQAYQVGAIPSLSYGLHLGSAEPNITGSLVLGGYDSSRCLTDPIVSSLDTVQLQSIALNVSSGGYAYLNTSSAYIPDLLRANGSAANNISVHPRPGVPHLYLPQDTCDAIAAHLPVTYSEAFNLYLWDTEKQAYKDIVSSPHHLSFTFSSDGGKESTISVPFAHLNLTLTTPIVSTPTQYFPCKPWTPDTTGYTLGGAFLQSAFLAQNWQESKIFLAQAPGPDFLSASIQKIGYTDTTLTPAKNPPSWEDSWSGTLKTLPARSSGASSSSSSPSDTSDPQGRSAVSGAAIGGIVVGVIAGLALVGFVAWFLIRRRKQRQHASHETARETAHQAPDTPFLKYHSDESSVPYLGKPALAPVETEGSPVPVSEMWVERDVAELPAGGPGKH